MTKKHLIIGGTAAAVITTGVAIVSVIAKHKHIATLFDRLDCIAESIDDIAIELVDHTKIMERDRRLIDNIDDRLEEIRNHTDDIASCIISMNERNGFNHVAIAIPNEKAAPTLTSDINTKEGTDGPM